MSRIEGGGAVEAGYGWVYLNEDTGIEWAEQHPVHSGEVPDATDVRVATAAVLQSLLTEAWSDNAAKDAEITRLRAENAGMREALGAIVSALSEQDDEGLIEFAPEMQRARAALSNSSQAEGQTR